MHRRSYLIGASTLLVTGLGGCLGNTPEARNEFNYPTLSKDGVEVPLVPIDDVINWYDDDNILFVDTRPEWQYEEVRIAGAVHSPAPDGHEADDPLYAADTDTRVVTYCTCPHKLSTDRGASAIKEGYTNLYAIDEGLRPWVERGYPVEGSRVQDGMVERDVEFTDEY